MEWKLKIFQGDSGGPLHVKASHGFMEIVGNYKETNNNNKPQLLIFFQFK